MSGLSLLFTLCVLLLQLSTSVAVQEEELEAIVETQGRAIASLEAMVNELMERQCECPQQDTIAFTVFMDYPSVDSVANMIIPFSKVRTILGSVFGNNTGTFTVPKDGTYVFYARMDCTADYRAFQLRVNGVQQAVAHNDADDHSLSTYVILALKKGDKVNLVHDRNGGKIDGGPESIFAGFRLGD